MNVMNLNVKFFVKSNCTKSQFINFPKVPTRKKINRIKNSKKEFHLQLLVQMLFCYGYKSFYIVLTHFRSKLITGSDIFISTLQQINDKRVRARQYPWGIAEIENEEHCDFKILRNMLIRTHMQVSQNNPSCLLDWVFPHLILVQNTTRFNPKRARGRCRGSARIISVVWSTNRIVSLKKRRLTLELKCSGQTLKKGEIHCDFAFCTYLTGQPTHFYGYNGACILHYLYHWYNIKRFFISRRPATICERHLKT